MFSEKELEIITARQIKRQNLFLSVPKRGRLIEYLGKKFVLFKGVFQPYKCGLMLIENFKVESNETVLDVGTGCGIIAIFAACKGAKKVIAVDKSAAAVNCAKENVKKHGLSGKIEVRQSDVFRAIKNSEKFDVITSNPPFRNKPASNEVEATQWDTNLQFHKEFFSNVRKHLKKNGRIYFCQADFGAVKEMKKMAKEAGLQTLLIVRGKGSDSKLETYFVFEMTFKKQ